MFSETAKITILWPNQPLASRRPHTSPTATRADGNPSKFSSCIVVSPFPGIFLSFNVLREFPRIIIINQCSLCIEHVHRRKLEVHPDFHVPTANCIVVIPSALAVLAHRLIFLCPAFRASRNRTRGMRVAALARRMQPAPRRTCTKRSACRARPLLCVRRCAPIWRCDDAVEGRHGDSSTAMASRQPRHYDGATASGDSR